MKVSEIFYSIQGESTHAGRPCAFIRLAGCDLRCSYCDTEYARTGGTEMSVPGILRSVAAYPTRLALVTGGEPMLQASVHDLFAALLERSYTVLLETGGHRPLGGVDPRVCKIMDFKCPSSKMADRNLYENIRFLTPRDELKFVVSDREDFDWACGLIRRHRDALRVGSILVSPVGGTVPPDTLAGWILECGLDVRLQLQLHRILWPGIDRGA